MDAVIHPQAPDRRWINRAVKAEINLCFTCGSCAVECPVNRATNRLDPRRLVWMANLGLMDELIRLPDIWLCLGCRKCSHVCPMTVKPAALIAFLRWEALREGLFSPELAEERRRLQDHLHRQRAAVVRELLAETAQRRAPQELSQPRTPGASWKPFAVFHDHETGISSCFACGECSNACPVCVDRSVLDPLVLVRGTLLGYARELSLSPGPWVCLQCRSCSSACSHRVQGHLVALALREAAQKTGMVDDAFLQAWKDKERDLWHGYAEAVVQRLEPGLNLTTNTQQTVTTRP
ncbi:4Fe-4S dicluster domain-containing protein [Desulfosoma sp.]